MSVQQEICKNNQNLPKKESRRYHRRNKEFTQGVKDDCFKKVGGKCESCSNKLTKKSAHFHHILPLSVAFRYYNGQFSDEILKSKHNCQVLCECCHTQLHENDSLETYDVIAQTLLLILSNWEPTIVKRRTTKNREKQKRRLMNQIEKERREKLRITSIDHRKNKSLKKL